MADARECRRQAKECTRLSRTKITPRTTTVLLAMAGSWSGLAGQMDRLADADPALAKRVALPRWWIAGRRKTDPD